MLKSHRNECTSNRYRLNTSISETAVTLHITKNDLRLFPPHRFNQHREVLHQNLFCVNPTVAQIHQLWDSYSHLHLISVESLSENKGAYDLFDFTVIFDDLIV